MEFAAARQTLPDRLQAVAARAVARPLFWLAAVALLAGFPIVRALRVRLPPPPPLLGAMPAFSLVDPLGQTVRFTPGAAGAFEEISGRVWIASFLAPKEAIASPFLARLQELQDRLRNLGESFALVSFCRDATPAELAAVGRARRASPRLWKLLAGQPPELEAAAEAAFAKAVGGKLSDVDRESLTRGNSLLLVDGRGRIRGVYDGSDKLAVETLIGEVGLLANHVH